MPAEQPLELDVADIITILKQGTLEAEGVMPYSSNYTVLTTVSYQGITTLAVYKPRRGERPLWDFPRGTLYQREVAAFLVSEALGFALVPPTVVCHGPFGVGALQLYIDNDQESHLFTMQKEQRYEPTLRQLAAFDYLINNADRKSGHCLRGLDDRLWAIDHGICFHVEYKLRTVLWDYIGEPLPSNVRAGLQHFNECLAQKAPVACELAELLDRDELRALQQRLNVLLRGGKYPAPGDGPNVPWPPV